MKKSKLLKLTTYIAIVFLAVYFLAQVLNIAELALESPLIWVGIVSLLIHYFMVLFEMIKMNKWAYAIASFLFLFIPTMAFYFIEMKGKSKNA